MNINWSHPNLLPKKLIFVDGVTRSGKSMVGPVISSLKGAYAFQHQAILDNLMPLLKKKSIRLDAAKSLLAFYFNQNIYSLNISREINLRPSDHSSVTKDKNYKNFLKNLKKPDGDYVIKEIKKKNNFPVFMSHDLLSMIEIFEKFNFNYKLIYTFRHPIDNIFSLINRYKRVKAKNRLKYNYNNPRIYSMMIKKNNILLPYYTFGKEKLFLKLNHAEKYTFYYLHSLKNSLKQYKNFKKKDKIYLLSYDNFAVNTKNEIRKLAKFLSFKVSNFTNKSLKKENLPRKLDTKSREKKKEIIRNMINEKMFNEVNDLSIKYDKKILF